MAEGRGGGRTTRTRTWIGLSAVAVGALLAGDPGRRAHAALEWATTWWPWLLLALASLNLLRSAVPTGSLIGPLLLAGIASAALVAAHGAGRRLVQDLLPVVLALGGAALVLSATAHGPATRWTRVLTTGVVVIPQDAGDVLTVRAVLGELRADLRHLDGASAVNVNVTALAGHVRLVVPRDSRITVHTAGTLLTRVTAPEPGNSDPRESGTFVIHVLGVCGAVHVVRG